MKTIRQVVEGVTEEINYSEEGTYKVCSVSGFLNRKGGVIPKKGVSVFLTTETDDESVRYVLINGVKLVSFDIESNACLVLPSTVFIDDNVLIKDIQEKVGKYFKKHCRSFNATISTR
jgi:hypothetical protein